MNFTNLQGQKYIIKKLREPKLTYFTNFAITTDFLYIFYFGSLFFYFIISYQSYLNWP